MIILQATEVDVITGGLKKNLKKRKKKYRSFSHPYDNHMPTPVFNLEALYYDEATDTIHFHEFVRSKDEAYEIVEALRKKNVFILDYHLKNEADMPGYLYDLVVYERDDLFYYIAYLSGCGYYFFENDRFCDNAMSDLLYNYAFCAVKKNLCGIVDFHEFIYLLTSGIPAAGISYWQRVLETSFTLSPLEFNVSELTLHLALIWGMHLSPASSSNAALAGVHGGEDTVLEHAINVLNRVTNICPDAIIRYAAFMHDVGKIKNEEILQAFGLEEALRYKKHYERGACILSCILEKANIKEKEKQAIIDVALYHGEIVYKQGHPKFFKMSHENPLSYDALYYTMLADHGSCI